MEVILCPRIISQFLHLLTELFNSLQLALRFAQLQRLLLPQSAVSLHQRHSLHLPLSSELKHLLRRVRNTGLQGSDVAVRIVKEVVSTLLDLVGRLKLAGLGLKEIVVCFG